MAPRLWVTQGPPSWNVSPSTPPPEGAPAEILLGAQLHLNDSARIPARARLEADDGLRDRRRLPLVTTPGLPNDAFPGGNISLRDPNNLMKASSSHGPWRIPLRMVGPLTISCSQLGIPRALLRTPFSRSTSATFCPINYLNIGHANDPPTAALTACGAEQATPRDFCRLGVTQRLWDLNSFCAFCSSRRRASLAHGNSSGPQ